ncbi:hypothetical protein [Streptomyces sp. cg2]|uniref:hypothetical protein n=1 Tax=Streptomyces sp. cg2 TaxID=3238799 RepID=UPI0034E2E38E
MPPEPVSADSFTAAATMQLEAQVEGDLKRPAIGGRQDVLAQLGIGRAQDTRSVLRAWF